MNAFNQEGKRINIKLMKENEANQVNTSQEIKPYFESKGVTIYHGDCIEVMKYLIKCGVIFDAIMADLPYGTTNLKGDVRIPMNDHVLVKGKVVHHESYLLRLIKSGIPYREALNQWKDEHIKGLWDYYKGLIKTNGAIVLNGSQPFSSYLINSNTKWFRYEWIWQKALATGGLNANKMPLKNHENVLVFYAKLPTYNPQDFDYKSSRFKIGDKSTLTKCSDTGLYREYTKKEYIETGKRKPLSVVYCSNIYRGKIGLRIRAPHPNLKPLPLSRMFIKTYTNPGDSILDNTAGSGTTAVAAIKENRRCVLIEQDIKYCEIAKGRIVKALSETG